MRFHTAGGELLDASIADTASEPGRPDDAMLSGPRHEARPGKADHRSLDLRGRHVQPDGEILDADLGAIR